MMNRLIGTLRSSEYLHMVRTLEREINQYSIEICERMNKLRRNSLLRSVGNPQAHPDEETLCQEIARLREARRPLRKLSLSASPPSYGALQR